MKDLKITKGEWEVNHDAIANDITELAKHITIVANDWQSEHDGFMSGIRWFRNRMECKK